MKILKIAFLGLLIFSGLMHAAEPVKAQRLPLIHKNMIITLPIVAITMWLSGLLHEFGHAITYYAFTGIFPHIEIGIPEQNHEAYIDTKTLTINSFFPITSAYIEVPFGAIDKKPYVNSLKMSLEALNGPLFGIATALAINHCVVHKMLNPTWIDQALIHTNIIMHLSELIPFHKGDSMSDGYRICAELCSQDTLKTIEDRTRTILPYLIGSVLGLIIINFMRNFRKLETFA